MLILLPPSERKADVRAGRRLDLTRLSLPELTPAREAALAALVDLAVAPDDAGMRALGLGDGQRGELARNARLRAAAAGPAGAVYTGVLYEALDLATLPPAALRAARRQVLVASGLWGAVRLADRIPPYRCPIGVVLPGLGALSAYWKGVLGPAMESAAADGPVLDLRSAAYAAAWTPRGALAERTVAVRVLHEREVDGVVTRSVVSHFNKATKGRLARDLLTAGARPRDAAELVTALRDLKHTVVEQSAAPGRARRVDVVVGAL
ncbi:peroxide stress protein YaaA [Micromonospora sp. WMMD882]|uniref:peroxide stress protein YaaA n=1 Tax=Micromonospora sp. WMMD882 TaxID=3015151 RepID=UPI00248BEC72|nr:peroxide stress protein YaaA [Micromonospora sp. WMMD882]WBB81609.1 peroxide stress protein YaaA [Micromonospora sp. WMMD882]